jgi:hypothetical protein
MNFATKRSVAEFTSFPFSEGMAASLNGVVLDARINLPSGSSGAFLRQISSSGGEISVIVNAVEGEEIGRGKTSSADGVIRLVGPSGAHAGVLVVSMGAPQTSGLFTRSQARFESACVVPSPFRSVRSLSISGRLLSGKIALAEGSGIRLVKMADNKLRIDAIGSTEDLERCCPDLKPAILKINDAVPDERGNISIEPMPFDEPRHASDLMQILRVSTGANSINLYLAK